ncbi:ANTAR domain-containing protein [Streptomyces sclerotialus]|uniref:ANTAR domain-containing protein n=1 Tax=Streptomyces sclerotialus TaxID=1957 RepID=UPI00099D8C6A
MADHQRFLGEVSRFAALLATRPPVGVALQNLAGRSAAALAVRSTGVSLVRDGRLRPVAALDRMAAELAAVQVEQPGPCSEALRTVRPVISTDLERDVMRWPGYGERALGLGLAATASVPLHMDGHPLGTLDLYHTAQRPWPPEDLDAVRVLTDMAVTYLAQAEELNRHRTTVSQLEHALESRVVIEQAKGMLAAERRISPAEAFECMRRYARNRGIKLRGTAEAVVTEGLRP